LEREEGLIGELQVLVAQNPYRERFVAQLMLALYRTGRHADALDVYEKTRGVLDDVGLQPSTELQQLSGQIVRQEPQLNRPASAVQRDSKPPTRRSRTRAVGLALGAALTAVMALTVGGSGPHPATAAAASASSARVALVLPRSPAGDVQMLRYRDAVRFTPALKLTTETLVADEVGPDASAVDALETRLRNGRFGLVIWVVDEATGRVMTPLVTSLPATKFVFVDTSLRALSLERVPNASAVRFAEEETSELVGYLSGLVPPRGRPARERADVVAVSAGSGPLRSTATFGASSVASQQRFRARKCSSTTRTKPSIARLASRLRTLRSAVGAEVVFAAAGSCGSGALAVARTRGVWGAGDEESASQPADLSADLLVRTRKEPELAVNLVLRRFAQDTLPAGRDLVLRLNDNYAVGLTTSWKAPSAAVSKMIERCSTIRRRAEAP
jgi:basic membrane lipoprotein Med (substrate-binding protein (PBP1-ABC) superfamily)